MKKSLLITAAAVLSAGSFYLAADDRFEREAYNGVTRSQAPYAPAQPRSDTPQASLYKSECGSCHMAYQPGLLPKRSWEKVMGTLESHFGSDATLESEDVKSIGGYLAANAADVRRTQKHMARIAASVSADAPMRISESAYFVREHNEIPARFVEQPEVKSFANCNACHTRAEAGSYRERDIRIPNYGRWDD
jgi:mono/diheme cytochrome c family protein